MIPMQHVICTMSESSLKDFQSLVSSVDTEIFCQNEAGGSNLNRIKYKVFYKLLFKLLIRLLQEPLLILITLFFVYSFLFD